MFSRPNPAPETPKPIITGPSHAERLAKLTTDAATRKAIETTMGRRDALAKDYADRYATERAAAEELDRTDPDDAKKWEAADAKVRRLRAGRLRAEKDLDATDQAIGDALRVAELAELATIEATVSHDQIRRRAAQLAPEVESALRAMLALTKRLAEMTDADNTTAARGREIAKLHGVATSTAVADPPDVFMRVVALRDQLDPIFKETSDLSARFVGSGQVPSVALLVPPPTS